jgi:hypothetical protein
LPWWLTPPRILLRAVCLQEQLGITARSGTDPDIIDNVRA